MQIVLGVAPLTWVPQAVGKIFLPALSSPAKMRALIQSRTVQFGLKFWFCISSITAAALILQQDWQHGKAWSPFYAVITTPIVFSERVRHTLFTPLLGVLPRCETACAMVANAG